MSEKKQGQLKRLIEEWAKCQVVKQRLVKRKVKVLKQYGEVKHV